MFAVLKENCRWYLALVLAAPSVALCASSNVDLSAMDARAQAAAPKSSVFYTPPKREKSAMTADERSKLKSDLSAARDRQSTTVKSRNAKPAKR